VLTGRVSVVIPLFNGRELISACIDSIDEGTEIVVVDDGSTDGAPELVESTFPNVTLLRNDHNVGFGTTSNRGLAACTRTVRLVLNSDARLRPGALERLAAAFDDPEVGIAGGHRVFPDGTHQTSAARFPTPGSIVAGSFFLNEVYRKLRPRGRFPLELGLSERDHAADREVDWVSGTCLALRDRCFDETGGFDEGYYLYGEETDLCWRAWRAGWHVRYVADAVVEHAGGGSTGDPKVHARRFITSEARFMVRAYGPRIWNRWRLARLTGSALKSVLLLVPALIDRRARVRWRWQVAAFAAVVKLGRPS
jgi:GT2 family glycosyltransferase